MRTRGSDGTISYRKHDRVAARAHAWPDDVDALIYGRME